MTVIECWLLRPPMANFSFAVIVHFIYIHNFPFIHPSFHPLIHDCMRQAPRHSPVTAQSRLVSTMSDAVKEDHMDYISFSYISSPLGGNIQQTTVSRFYYAFSSVQFLMLSKALGKDHYALSYHDSQKFPSMYGRPDMTSAVDWALKVNYLSIPQCTEKYLFG